MISSTTFFRKIVLFLHIFAVVIFYMYILLHYTKHIFHISMEFCGIFAVLSKFTSCSFHVFSILFWKTCLYSKIFILVFNFLFLQSFYFNLCFLHSFFLFFYLTFPPRPTFDVAKKQNKNHFPTFRTIYQAILIFTNCLIFS